MLATSRNIISSDATTQKLLAPIQDDLIAKQNYTQGQQFILGGALFKVIKSGGISTGDTINMNTDVEPADTITDQISDRDRIGFSQIQYGTVSLGTLSQGLNNIEITFNTPFTTGKNITVVANIHGPFTPINEVSGPAIVLTSNTGFRVRVYNSYTGSSAIAPSLDYIAIS